MLSKNLRNILFKYKTQLNHQQYKSDTIFYGLNQLLTHITSFNLHNKRGGRYYISCMNNGDMGGRR